MDRDWKKLEYREELFFRYLLWRTSVHDLDHSHYCKVLTEGKTEEQKLWFSLLFGMTYRTPQAYAYLETFPYISKINLDKLEEWHTKNWKRTTYGTDARYNKGHFHKQVASVLEWKGSESLFSKFRKLTRSSYPEENFLNVFEAICGLYKFGRMTAWIACQGIFDTVGLPMDFDHVLIRNPSSDSSMQSVWNGYCTLKGHYDKMLGKQYGAEDRKVTEKHLYHAREDMFRYREKATKVLGYRIDIFKWESIWCQFKRLFHPKESREYPGHSSGDAVSRYPYYVEHWPEINWKPFKEALLSQPGLVCGRTYVNDYNKVFGKTGLLLNMHEMFPDMKNGYEVLGLDPEKDRVKLLYTKEGE